MRKNCFLILLGGSKDGRSEENDFTEKTKRWNETIKTEWLGVKEGIGPEVVINFGIDYEGIKAEIGRRRLDR